MKTYEYAPFNYLTETGIPLALQVYERIIDIGKSSNPFEYDLLNFKKLIY